MHKYKYNGVHYVWKTRASCKCSWPQQNYFLHGAPFVLGSCQTRSAWLMSLFACSFEYQRCSNIYFTLGISREFLHAFELLWQRQSETCRQTAPSPIPGTATGTQGCWAVISLTSLHSQTPQPPLSLSGSGSLPLRISVSVFWRNSFSLLDVFHPWDIRYSIVTVGFRVLKGPRPAPQWASCSNKNGKWSVFPSGWSFNQQ